jgi:hypothetical protein
MKKHFKIDWTNIKYAYLYADGHVVIAMEKRTNIKGTSVATEWAEIIEGYCRTGFQRGRIIIRDLALLELMENAFVDVSEPSADRGSENTKRMGIQVSTLSVSTAKGNSLHISSFPDLISASFSYQNDVSEKFEDVSHRYNWHDSRIVKVYTLDGRNPQDERIEA